MNPRFNRALPAMVLAELVLIAHAPALAAGFVWDDEFALLGNPLLRDGKGLLAIWTGIGAIPREAHWWPLTYTLFWIEHALFGWRPAFFHAISLVLHLAVVMQIRRLLRRLAFNGAWIAAALYAVHPVHVEAVAWVVEQKDLLAALLFWLAVEAFLRYRDGGRAAWLGWMAWAAMAAMLAKSSAVVLPFALFLTAWWKSQRVGRRDLAGILIAAVIALSFGALDWLVGRALREIAVLPPPLPVRIAHASHALWFYAAKLAWPVELTVLYPQWTIDPSRWSAWLPLVAGLGLTVLLWTARRRIGRGSLVCWLFFAGALAPTLGLLWFNFLTFAPAADRYQYLAGAAPLAGLAWLARAALDRARGRIKSLAYAAVVLVLALLAAKTWNQTSLYRSRVLLFGEAVRINPRSPVAHTNYGIGLLREKSREAAVPEFREALRLDPGNPVRYTNLAFVLKRMGRDAESLGLYREALERDPADAEALAAINADQP